VHKDASPAALVKMRTLEKVVFDRIFALGQRWSHLSLVARFMVFCVQIHLNWLH